MQLATLSQLKSHLGIPQADVSKDAVLNFLLSGASGYIETETSRKFELQQYTIKLSGEGTDMLVLPQYPIHVVDSVPAISALTLDGVTIDLDTLDIDIETGILYRNAGVWSAGSRNIAITYSAGYKLAHVTDSGSVSAPTVPEALQLAAIRLAARLYERKTAEGVASVSPASYSVTYKDGIDEDIQSIIDTHTRFRL